LLNIVRGRYWYFLLSLIIIVPGTISLITHGLKLGTDFTGGTELTVRIPQANQNSKLGSVVSSQAGPVSFVQAVLGTKCPTDCQYIVRSSGRPARFCSRAQ
jgi:preprotein translocase subunit SecF